MAARWKTVRGFLREIMGAVRAAVGPEFPISVKLNSADFQKGGFAFEDSIQVLKWLEEDSADLIEISGGNYEQPKLMGMEGMEAEETKRLSRPLHRSSRSLLCRFRAGDAGACEGAADGNRRLPHPRRDGAGFGIGRLPT